MLGHFFGLTLLNLLCLSMWLSISGGSFTRKNSSVHGKEGDKVCYDGLPCYALVHPWYNVSVRDLPLPRSPSKVSTISIFFSRENTIGQNITVYPNVSSFQGFKPDREMTIFICHGWMASAGSPWVLKMKDKFLENLDANVFLIDWAKPASSLDYEQAASDTRTVADEQAKLLDYLNSKGMDVSSTYLIGHSLGAHVVGYIGKYLKKQDKLINRITGLDPAGLGFMDQPPEVRLSKSDASFVDIIHTDGKPLIPILGFGLWEPIGHVDFYINKGSHQPGCDPDLSKVGGPNVFSDIETFFKGIFESLFCSHSRSHDIFIASIDPAVDCNFTGYKIFSWLPYSVSLHCYENDCSELGLDTPEFPGRGSFEVETSSTYPYCAQPEVSNIFTTLKQFLSDLLTSGIFFLKSIFK